MMRWGLEGLLVNEMYTVRWDYLLQRAATRAQGSYVAARVDLNTSACVCTSCPLRPWDRSIDRASELLA